MELVNAELLDALCERYGCLPWPGALMEQPAIPFLRIQSLVGLAKGAAEAPTLEEEVFAGIPMMAMA